MRRAKRVGDQGDQDYFGYGAAYGYGNEQHESQADWAEAGQVPPTHSLTAD